MSLLNLVEGKLFGKQLEKINRGNSVLLCLQPAGPEKDENQRGGGYVLGTIMMRRRRMMMMWMAALVADCATIQAVRMGIWANKNTPSQPKCSRLANPPLCHSGSVPPASTAPRRTAWGGIEMFLCQYMEGTSGIVTQSVSPGWREPR